MTEGSGQAEGALTDLDTLKALRERVREARGPDRELDADVMAGCFDWARRGEPYLFSQCIGDEPIYFHAPEPYRKGPVPRISASLDAALALVTRLFPERYLHLTEYRNGNEDDSWFCTLINRRAMHQVKHIENLATPALALLAAALSAIIAEKEGAND